jgi:hypothetical protein
MTGLLRWTVPLCCCLWSGLLMSSEGPEGLTPEQFCITEGHIVRSQDPWLKVDSTKMRAVLGFPSKPDAEMRFRYLGETAERSLLRSGAERTQIGLKLKAQDDCNVVYVMWRIGPVSKLVVSVKSNPGQHRHAECGNSGYANMKGTLEAPVPKLEEGSEHSLRAVLDVASLEVYVDSALVWEGKISEDAKHFDGPVGLRSDNARFDFQVFAHPGSRAFACDKNRTE